MPVVFVSVKLAVTVVTAEVVVDVFVRLVVAVVIVVVVTFVVVIVVAVVVTFVVVVVAAVTLVVFIVTVVAVVVEAIQARSVAFGSMEDIFVAFGSEVVVIFTDVLVVAVSADPIVPLPVIVVTLALLGTVIFIVVRTVTTVVTVVVGGKVVSNFMTAMSLTTIEPDVTAAMPGMLCRPIAMLFEKVGEAPSFDNAEEPERSLGGNIVASTKTEPDEITTSTCPGRIPTPASCATVCFTDILKALTNVVFAASIE